MFGLNDNANNSYTDTTQLSASDTTTVNTTSPMDSPSPGITSSSAPEPGSPAKIAGIPASPTSSPTPNPSMPTPAGMGDVSLENAYIDNGPATHANKDAQSPAKPTAAALVNGANEDELLKLKQQALQSLAPLVDHLEQDPEAKFKTTMMMIQASDNADLIPEAYDAANKIPDEKVRAQALLDVINEINYFTQHSANAPQ
jgi:hypothetical protein